MKVESRDGTSYIFNVTFLKDTGMTFLKMSGRMENSELKLNYDSLFFKDS